MDSISLIGMVSILSAALCIAIGSIGPALGEGRAVAQALSSIAQQPDEAGADLEQQMLVVLLEQLHSLDEEAWQAMVVSLQDATQHLVVHSAFALPQAARQQLDSVLQQHLGEAVQVQFATVPDLICGIELHANGHKLAWSLEDYLGTLEESLSTAFALVRREAATDAGPHTTAEAAHDAGA